MDHFPPAVSMNLDLGDGHVDFFEIVGRGVGEVEAEAARLGSAAHEGASPGDKHDEDERKKDETGRVQRNRTNLPPNKAILGTVAFSPLVSHGAFKLGCVACHIQRVAAFKVLPAEDPADLFAHHVGMSTAG